MRKTVIIASLFFIVLLASLAYAANWQTVTTFQGSSDTTTNYFKIDATEWRIRWSYTPKAGIAGDLAVFSIFIYPKGETVNYVDFILKTGRNETSGTLYVHQSGREYYLKIGAANVDGYTVTVEQDMDTVPNSGNSSLGGAVFVVVVIVVIIIVAVMLFRRRKKTAVKAQS
jgi:hypothetical protein